MITSNIDDLVERFRESDNERERNNIFKVIRDIYLPKYYSKRNNYHRQWYDYLDSEYDLQVFRCMLKWDPNRGVMFSTYLYLYATVKPFSTVNEKYISKSRREINFTTLGWNEYDDDDY